MTDAYAVERAQVLGSLRGKDACGTRAVRALAGIARSGRQRSPDADQRTGLGRREPHLTMLLILNDTFGNGPARRSPGATGAQAGDPLEGTARVTDAQAFGLRLRDLRAEHGISQYVLAYRTGIHPTAIGRFERGDREPRLSSILRLARGLGVEPGEPVNGLSSALVAQGR